MDIFSEKNSTSELKSKAGIIMFIVGGVALLGIITAEVLYPGYSTLQEISDLGASRPPNSVIEKPAATVFNVTMIISGGLVLIATYLLHRVYERRGLSISLALFGLGIFGVGVFPGNKVPWHMIFAMLTFVSGGIAVAFSSRVVEGPFKYLCMIFSGISIFFLFNGIFLADAGPFSFLELGGIERWVVYPILLWTSGFGGYLLGNSNRSEVSKVE